MIEIDSSEALMVWIMNRLSEVYPDHAILKGGMVLRLMNCPRHTNDLDYVFKPFKYKKDILPMILKVLNELEGIKINHQMNSKALRIQIEYQGYRTQIEANVSKDCKTEPMSTSTLANDHHQLPRVIKVMSLKTALANKLAAWNERELMRDLYDIYFFSKVIGTEADITVLKKRLENIVSRKKNIQKKMTIDEFKNRLSQAVQTLSQKNIDAELSGSLPPEERAGLHYKIRIAVQECLQKIG